MKTLLQIGAGKIGRSFIAQIFNQAGYHVVFADVNDKIIGLINHQASYDVVNLSNTSKETIHITGIEGINIHEQEKLDAALVKSDIISVSVGKENLTKLAGALSKAVNRRYAIKPYAPIDIILAENVRDASSILKTEMLKHINNLPLSEYVGFVETSIGKMVPLQTFDNTIDPLSVIAEPYNDLIVDKLAFKGEVPDIDNIKPKTNMKAWVDRKIFIHNLGHSALAYYTHYENPEITYTWEALESNILLNQTRAVMHQSAEILLKMYPEEFTSHEIEHHIEDLLTRFSNRSLGDTIFRVGCDISRKLAADDRLMIPVTKATEHNLPFELILNAWEKGCDFQAKDSQGKLHPADAKFHEKYKGNRVKILKEHCSFEQQTEQTILKYIE